MSKALARRETRVRRRRVRWEPSLNTISFPRALREAIPDTPTCAGRVLELASTSGAVSRLYPGCPPVELRMLARETGQLTGEFVVVLNLQAEAARALAETLAKLADEVENSR